MPCRAGDVAQPGGGEVERGLTIRECAYDTRAPPDLAQDALERVVGANPPPVLLREGVVGERLLDRRRNCARLHRRCNDALQWPDHFPASCGTTAAGYLSVVIAARTPVPPPVPRPTTCGPSVGFPTKVCLSPKREPRRGFTVWGLPRAGLGNPRGGSS